MARIRTIKPEFWSDGSIHRLSDSCALFFVALWNFSDDFGFFSCDTLDLSLKCPRWRSQSIHRMLCALSDAALIRIDSKHCVGQVLGWEHQRIKDRRASPWNNEKIEWDGKLPDAPRSQKNGLGKERSGRERKGEEYKPRAEIRRAETPTPDEVVDLFGSGEPIRDEKTLGSEIWDSYSNAIRTRYEITPIRNAKTSSQCKQLGERLGRDAIEVAAFFVAHPDAVLRRDQHPLGILLAKAETFHAQWQRREHTTFEDVKAQGDNYHERQLARLLAKPSVSP